MEFGVGIFFTDYSISPTELAVAMEERGIDVLWAPEHSHISASRQTGPDGGALDKRYYDVMDPFVTLAAAAAATKRLKVGTGVCLVIQRDTIQTAKQVASLDQVSGGRFLFGIGGGWNKEEMEDHGTEFTTRFKRMREQIEAMTEIWTKEKAEYHGEIVDFTPMMTWPKPVQKPRPPVLVGGAFPWAARRAIRYGDGWFPIAGGARYGDPLDYLPLPPDARRGRARSGSTAGDLGRRSRGPGHAQALSRSRGGSGELSGAAGKIGRGSADPRPPGQAEAAARLTT